MTSKGLAIMAGALVVLGVPAFWLYTKDRAGWAADRDPLSGEPALPALADLRPGDLAALELRDRDGSVRIEKKDASWVLPDKGGYPARTDRVTELVRGLQTMRVMERGTSRPDKFDRVGLVAPDDGGEESVLVRVLGADDRAIGEVLLGNRAFDRSEDAVWIRRVGEDQTLLASGAPPRETSAADWFEKSLLKIPSQRVRSVAVEFAEPDAGYSLVRDDPSGFGFTFAPLPEGRELVEEWRYTAVARAVAALNSEDVESGDLETLEGERVHVHYETYDGLAVDLDAVRLPGATDVAPGPVWATLAVGSCERFGGALPQGQPFPDATAVDAERADLAARTGGWRFRLPAAVGANLFAQRESLLKPLPVEQPPPAPTEESDGPRDDESAPAVGADGSTEDRGDAAVGSDGDGTSGG
ncbi:MAG: DUF4340 domain-containing protein [Planctomycetota bacterium]